MDGDRSAIFWEGPDSPARGESRSIGDLLQNNNQRIARKENHVVQSLRPLADFIDPVDVPLYDFLEPAPASPGEITGIFDEIMVADAWSELSDTGFILDAQFHLGSIPPLHLPGLDQVRLKFNDDGIVHGRLTCSEDSTLQFDGLDLALEFSPDLLRHETDDESARVGIKSCAVTLDRDGFHFQSFGSASLPRSRIGRTPIVVSLHDIALGRDRSNFFSIGSGDIELPMFSSGTGPLRLTGQDMKLGSRGLSGKFAKAPGAPLELSLFGFRCQIHRAAMSLEDGVPREIDLCGRLDVSSLGVTQARWLDVEFSIGSAGLTAAVSAAESVIDVRVPGLFLLAVRTLRFAGPTATAPAALWLSGTLTPQIEGLEGDWPAFEFEEIGITADGKFLFARGAQIATAQPFTLRWQFASLCVTAFSLERPEDAPEELKLRISASVELVKGLPAGASVEGLIARWTPAEVHVSFAGIGLSFGSPGAFAGSALVAWDSKQECFKGSGSLEMPSIDLYFSALFEARRFKDAQFNACFIVAETSLPGGIPIASTGLCLYAVSGLLAYNYELATDASDPRPHYSLFQKAPQGFGSITKWRPKKGARALALGVVVGTADDGWAFSALGALIVSLRDLSVLATAQADVLTQRPTLLNGPPGKLAALLALHPAQELLRLDFGFEWTEKPLFRVTGEGGGEFHFRRPLDWTVFAGRPPEQGKPISASLLQMDSDWLIDDCGYWVLIDSRRSVVIGALAAIDLRSQGGRVYAAIVGSVRADLCLAWAPYQLEGNLAITGSARLSAGRLSLGFDLSAGVEVYLPAPKYLNIPLEACLRFRILGKRVQICLPYTFSWGSIKRPAPTMPPLALGLTLQPRDWVPQPTSNPDRIVDDGSVTWPLSTTTPAGLKRVRPHSILALEFSKSVVPSLPASSLVDLNAAAIPYPESIGRRSGYSARWLLKELVLTDEDAGHEVALFGTFQRSPLEREHHGQSISSRPPNTQLWLLSSKRFGSEGSLGGGGVEETPPLDCTPKDTTQRTCFTLAGLSPGYGLLSCGWAYQWRDTYHSRAFDRYGVRVGIEGLFQFLAPEHLDAVTLTYIELTNGTLPAEPWIIQEEILANPAPRPVEAPRPPRSDRLYLSLCWDTAITATDSVPSRSQAGSSGHEEWNDPYRILHPGHRYTLRVAAVGELLLDGRPVAHLPVQYQFEFQADRAPDWPGALNAAVAAVYPSNGLRPAFRHYDLIVHFNDDYVRALYELDGRRLAIRLLDSNGVPVEFSPGRTLSAPGQWSLGSVASSPVEQWWREVRGVDHCETGERVPTETETILPVELSALHLLPLACYTAEIVAVEDEATESIKPLYRWTFTTSAFATFTELASPPATIPVLGLLQSAPPSEGGFDALVRSFGAQSIALVQSLRITPVRRGDNLMYVLIESPEPLDDLPGRLTVAIEGREARLVSNLDYTRIVGELDRPIPLADAPAAVGVTLTWNGAPPGCTAEHRRIVTGQPVLETCVWSIPLQGVI